MADEDDLPNLIDTGVEFFSELESQLQWALRDAAAMASLSRGDTVLANLARILRDDYGLPIASSHSSNNFTDFAGTSSFIVVFEVDRHHKIGSGYVEPAALPVADSGAFGYDILASRAKAVLEKVLTEKLGGLGKVRVFFPPYALTEAQETAYRLGGVSSLMSMVPHD